MMTTDGEIEKIERAYREIGQESPDHERRLRLTARESEQLLAELDGPEAEVVNGLDPREEHIARVVAAAPPLTGEQADLLRGLFASTRQVAKTGEPDA